MKHDPYFKYLAATVLVGLLLAFINTTTATEPAHPVPVNAAAGSPHQD